MDHQPYAQNKVERLWSKRYTHKVLIYSFQVSQSAPKYWVWRSRASWLKCPAS